MISLESVLHPEPETFEKLMLVRRLLKEGLPTYKAVRRAKLGWKNLYKYASLIYDNPEVPVPLPKSFLRDYEYRCDVEGMRVLLDAIAKYTATKIIARALTEGRAGVRRNPGKAWFKVCKDLQIKWIHELCISTLT